MDTAELEHLRHQLKQKELELDAAGNELAKLAATLEETHRDHASSRERSTNNESYAEELEEELRTIAAERDEALHSLEMVVKEIESEEERFENELELQKSITLTKAQSQHSERREMGHRIAALEEERGELLRQLENSRDDRRRSGVGGHTKSPAREPQREQSLFAELADTSNECAECLDWQQKLDLANGQQKNELAKVARLEVDLADRSTLLDQVISKWTAAVASFTMHREGDPSCPCGDCTLNRNSGVPAAAPQQPAAPPTPEQHQAKERKKRRGLRWRSFVPGMKSADRLDARDRSKSPTELPSGGGGGGGGGAGKRGGKQPSSSSRKARGPIGRGQPIPSTRSPVGRGQPIPSSAGGRGTNGRQRGSARSSPLADVTYPSLEPPGVVAVGPERHANLDKRQHNPGSKQRLPQKPASNR